ncbi:ATP-binding cassette domain-containing protein [Frankia sp. CNm7]|uniref:ATP-binding cassette domain-containing protein n=1 Tax=Frankia nepalensis TaxID=1836974 RepID=A0A937RJJ8_9ACTN|nr:ATP-binding cassette domain-containing protein [Frankia nepalensis]MBL7498863.1 ATP-binding cassette domain-containing protein [Frankia nepalensis]MBL7513695.1 ATP-binding cassette domain-containing protein [Frankia nepalensis]MBL7524160.1 ATP-binding cassette domain-containing protein [Frankia nepalensis]MBL7631357.1 ATP-binding cassette domain-containing protein [Frankia nepalensis]
MTDQDDVVIEVAGATKTFVQRRRGERRLRRERVDVAAVRDVSFTVRAGEIVGYLGPNGAGKSTTIKMLIGVLTPTSGRLRVAGIDPARQRIALARRIGVVFGQRSTLWYDLPLRDSFALARHLYRIPDDRFQANLRRFVEMLDLGPFLDTPVRQLSLGQRMRGDLTAAFLHDPAIVYLDEPTIGLDVVSKAAVRAFLAETNRENGTTIMLTTHDTADIEQLCRRVLVIDHGRLGFDGELAVLRERLGGDRTLVVDLAEPLPALSVATPGARVIRVDGPRQWLAFPATASAAPLVAEIAARYPLVDLSIREPPIEEVVTRLYTSGAPTPRPAPD